MYATEWHVEGVGARRFFVQQIAQVGGGRLIMVGRNLEEHGAGRARLD
jgi:hypothetical protein